MFCLKCGKQIPDTSSFCMHCGTLIPQVPSAAKAENPDDRAVPPAPEMFPFGEAEETIEVVPQAESFVIDSFETDAFEEELETFSPFLDTPNEETFVLPPMQAGTVRHCKLCSRELTATNTSGYCVTCMNNRSFVPSAKAEPFSLELDLDAEYPPDYRDDSVEEEKPQKQKRQAKAPKKQKMPKAEKPPKEKKRLRLGPVLLLSLVTLGLALFTLFFISGQFNIVIPGFSAELTGEAREASGYAQAMVKEKAANPNSVHFDSRTLTASERNGVWTVKQSFERLAADGNMAKSSYVAMLKLDGSSAKGYQAIMLEVGGDILYDTRT